MIYLYGLVEPQGGACPKVALGSIAGVTSPVSADPCGDLFLIHGQHDGSEILPRRKSLLTHARVLEAAMEIGTVLPMRFGMTCRSLEVFHDIADRSSEEIRKALDRLRDRAEVGVRVTVPEEAALEAALAETPSLAAARDRLTLKGGATHFAKVEFGRSLGEVVAARRQAAQKALLKELVPLAAAHVLKAPETDFEVIRAEFLVEKDRLADFPARIEQVVAELGFAGKGEYATRLVGPGPGFHFVDLSLAPTDAEEAA